MEKLLDYLNSIPVEDQRAFCLRCETSVGYLRKAISLDQKMGESLCIRIERESRRKVTCEDLRPDVDWAYLRGTSKRKAA